MGDFAQKAVIFAILAALFYAISSPVAKVLLEDIDPNLMAALLYLGAGTGMFLIRTASKNVRDDECELTRGDLPYIVAMIILDIAAPLLLMHGLLTSTASSVSLLNNFEIVATTVIAMLVFGERVSGKTGIAIILIVISAMMLSYSGEGGFDLSTGSLSVLAACVCWGLENNCTRRLSDSGPIRIVTMKGLFSGLGALLIALYLGFEIPDTSLVVIALVLGFVSYGLSLFFYISAQRDLGAAKVSAYYALAPFMGVALAMVFLDEVPDVTFLLALVVMIAGTAILTLQSLKEETE